MMAFWGGTATGSWLNASQRRQRAYERLSAFHNAVEEEAARGSVRDVDFRRAAKVPVVTFVDVHTNVSVDVSVEAPDGPHSSAAVRAALTTAPQVGPLVIALKIALAQHSLNKPFHGGVGPFVTCAMVCDALRVLGGPTLSCCEVVGSGADGAGSSSGGVSSSHSSSSNHVRAPGDLSALLQSVLAVYTTHDEQRLHLYDAITGRELGGAAWAWPRVMAKLRSWHARLATEGCLSAMLHGWPRQEELLPDRAALERMCAFRQPSSTPRVHRGSLSRGGGGSSSRSRESRSRSRRGRSHSRSRWSHSHSRWSRSRSPNFRQRGARRSGRSRSRSAERDDRNEARGGRRRRRRHCSSSSSSDGRRRRRSTSRQRRRRSSRSCDRSRSRSDRGRTAAGRRRPFYEEPKEGWAGPGPGP